MVLGHAAADEVRVDRGFLELGFDSVTAAELVGRLGAAIGRELPTAAVFDHRTPTDLAEHLDALLGEPAQAEQRPPEEQIEGGQFNTLFGRAIELGKANEFMDFLDMASRFRRTFDDPTDLTGTVDISWISTGGSGPALVCLPGFIGMPGPQQFARFAAPLRDDHEVSVLQHPGFTEGELLPSDIDALIRLHARTVLAHYADRPFALVGLSSGGLVAQTLARHLEAQGVRPCGVVLLDTFGPHLAHITDALIPEFAVRLYDVHVGMGYAFNDDWLTAMGRYVAFPWKIQDLASPILLVRATVPLIEWTRDEDWRTSWESAHSVVDVPGDHFSMMGDYADHTAAAVDAWLRRVATPPITSVSEENVR